MKPTSFKRAFVVTFIFTTLAAALFWLDFFRSYRGDVTVLIVSKTSKPAQELTDNAAELAGMLSFYERVLQDNDLIDDEFTGYAPDERKNLWNNKLSVRRDEKSGILTLSVREDTPEKAARLAGQVAHTLFATMSFYYNAQTEIDLRIVDGPLVSYTLARPASYVFTSVFSGLFISLLFFGFLKVASKFSIRSKIEASKNLAREKFIQGASVPWIDPRKFMPEKPLNLPFGDFSASSMKQNESRTIPSPYVAHAPAPANLPVAPVVEPEAPSDEEMKEPAVMFPPSEPVSAEPRLDEPTAEEYKRRLNELLSGL